MSGEAPAANRVALREAVELRAHELGFALVGVARAAPSARGAELRRWISEGKHGEMSWIAERVEQAVDVRTMLKNARSVVCVADRYHDGRPDRAERDSANGAPRGRIATDITYEDGRKGRIEADLEIRDVAPAPVPAARGAAA